MRDRWGISAADIPKRELDFWAELGPVRYRLRSLAVAVGFWVVGAVLWLATGSLFSLYPGASGQYKGPPERPATASVKTCHRVGPVSDMGFGWWWVCEATVVVEGGRTVQITTDRSKLTPADAGRPVDFREACFDKEQTDCAYGRPGNYLLAVVVGTGLKLRLLMAIFGYFIIGVYVLRSLLGAPRFYRLARRMP